MNQVSSPASEATDLKTVIDARRKRLRLSMRDLAKATNIAVQTLDNLLKGHGNPRRSTEHRLKDGLGWAHGSIQRIRDGQDPIVVTDTPASVTESEQAEHMIQVPSPPPGDGFRSVTRVDGTVEYWLTEQVAGRPLSLHYPARPGEDEARIRSDLELSMAQMKLVFERR